MSRSGAQYAPPAGSTQIVTLGTVTTGTWNATAIAAAYIDASIARLASPTFTGTPVAPTPAVDTNTTQIATTAFVIGQRAQTGDEPVMDGVQNLGSGLRFARWDHVHASDTSRAPATGSAAIVTLGTVTTGTWNATTIAAAYVDSAIARLASPTFTGAVGLPDVTVAAGRTLDMGANRVQNAADPASAQDLATKAYVDALKQGLDIKDSVRVVATSNLSLPATGGATLTVDGVVLSNGNRVLLTGQTASEENGIYEASGIGSAATLTRAADADSSADVTSGLYTFASEGTSNASSGWVLTTADPITLGTTGLSFTQFSGAGQIIAGTNLSKTGNTLAVVAAPTFTTQAVDTNNATAATTAFVIGQAYAKLNSPVFTGTPSLPSGTTAVTQTAGDSSTKIATTAFVAAAAPTLDPDLTAIAALTGTGIAERTGADTWALASTTGTGNIVRATSPTLVTPNLGVASATSLASSGGISATTALFSNDVTLSASIPQIQFNTSNYGIGRDGTNGTRLWTHPSSDIRLGSGGPSLGSPWLILSSGGANFNGNPISIGWASQAEHAVSKSYLEARGSDYSDWKNSVRVVATSNVDLANAGASIDGVTLAFNDRVLLVAQSTASENGIYRFSPGSPGPLPPPSNSTLARADDADSSTKLTLGTHVYVDEGSNAGGLWKFSSGSYATQTWTTQIRAPARTFTNWTIGSNARRSIDRNGWSTEQLFDFVMTMAYDLQQSGLYA